MDITEKDAFKLGFLTRCAEEELTGPALEARLEKVAELNKSAENWFKWSPIDPLRDPANLMTSGAKALAGWARMMYAIPPAASILGGSALGYGAAKMMEPQISDDEIRARELADTYKLYAEKAKARRKIRQYRSGHNDL